MVYNWGSCFQGKIGQERFRVVSRRAVNRVNQMNTYIPYRKAMYMNCGLKSDTLRYDNKKLTKKRHNKEEWGSRARPVEGWLSIMSLMSFGFFMMSVMLTLILKNLSVLLNMSFKRQHYVIEGVEKLT